MLFYPSKNHDRLNGKPFAPEQLTGAVMLNPKYKVSYVEGASTRVLVDSGAFQDISKHVRLTQEEALERQLRFIESVRTVDTASGVSAPLEPEGVCIYDCMLGVDEAIDINGRKIKQRGTRKTARYAIEETLRSADYYATARARGRFNGRLLFVGQGIDPVQYVGRCVRPMMAYVRDGDWFAFGGFCIVGRVPSLRPLLYETLTLALPVLADNNIRRVHLLGVTAPDVVARAYNICRAAEITCSVDSSSIEVNSVMGRIFSAKHGKWRYAYSKDQKGIDYHPNDLALANIRRFTKWCSKLAVEDGA